MKNKVTALELAFILFTINIAGKVHALPSILSGFADESLWVIALINYAIDFVLLIIVLSILNKIRGRSFYDVLIEKFGKVTGKVIVFILVAFLIAKSFIPFIEQKNSIELTFYETQPTNFTFLPVFIIVFYFALKGLWSFSKSVAIIFWGLIIGSTIILLLSLSAVDFERLLPFFAKPFYEIANGSIKTLIWFGDPLYLLFFSKHVDKSEKLNGKIITSYAISAVVYLVGLVFFYAVFENIAVRQYFAPLKMSKYSVTLSNIGRFDYIGTLLIVTANVYSLALPIIVASNLVENLFKFKSKYVAPLIVTGACFILTLITSHGFFAHLNFMQTYGVWFLIIVTYGLPIILWTLIRRNKNERI
ncbi:MAG: GerAB/ArcD/ProY family transporter [Clostridia bacterium]|nr:GerAB/ArcD/ProY family transporter [Clostridia bacterium]